MCVYRNLPRHPSANSEASTPITEYFLVAVSFEPQKAPQHSANRWRLLLDEVVYRICLSSEPIQPHTICSLNQKRVKKVFKSYEKVCLFLSTSDAAKSFGNFEVNHTDLAFQLHMAFKMPPRT